MTLPRLLTLGLVSATLLAATVACSSGSSDSSPTSKAGAVTTSTRADRDEPAKTTTTTTETETKGGGGGSDRQAYVDALAATFDEPNQDTLRRGQVDCLAGGFVDTIGMDKIKASDLSPKAFAALDGTEFPESLGVDDAKANELFDVYGTCEIDLAELIKAQFSSGETKLTPAQEACFDRLLTEDRLRASLVADILGKPLKDDPFDGLLACVPSGATNGPTASTLAPPTTGG